MDDHTVFHWRDVQERIRFDREFPVDGATAFFEWLATVDIDAITEPVTEATHRKVVRGVARNIPYPVYNPLYPVYGRPRSRADRIRSGPREAAFDEPRPLAQHLPLGVGRRVEPAADQRL